MASQRPFRVAWALLLASAVALASLGAPRVMPVPPGSFVPPSFVTHTLMLVLSLLAMGILSKGGFRRYGFSRGTYRFGPRILLWGLPTAALSIASVFASPDGPDTGGPADLTKFQLVVFVWVYASICEEVLTRGLLQTLLSTPGEAMTSFRRRPSGPVVVSAVFFGAMHLVLVQSMGPAAVPLILLAVFLGLIAGRYRERTGSLLPAILVHALFNIGGMLPYWMIHWFRG